MKKAGNQVGIKSRPHDPRRHSATHASRSGVTGEIVLKVILRHPNLAITQRYLGSVSVYVPPFQEQKNCSPESIHSSGSGSYRVMILINGRIGHLHWICNGLTVLKQYIVLLQNGCGFIWFHLKIILLLCFAFLKD